MAKRGRKQEYDRPLIMKRLAEYTAQGMSITEACKQEGMPHRDNIYIWAIDDEEIFSALVRAQSLWALNQSEQVIEIADNETRDYFIDNKGNRRSDNTAVNRDNLRIRTRENLMAKWFPKLFSDKPEAGISIGGVQGNITVNVLSSAELKKAVNAVSKQKAIEAESTKN